MNRMTRFIPVIIAVLAAGWLISKAVPPRDDPSGFHIQAFGALPVVYEGRVKPYDTLARNSLTIISDRQYFKDDDGDRREAIEWFLDVASGSHRAVHHKVFRIHNLELLDLLELDRRRGYRYSYEELEPKMMDFERAAMTASNRDRAERDAFEVQTLELYNKIIQFRILSEVYRIPQADEASGGLSTAMGMMSQLERFSLPHAIPPLHPEEAVPGTPNAKWQPMLKAILTGAAPMVGGEPHPLVRPLAGALMAWSAGDVATFNANVAECRSWLDAHPLPERPALELEQAFNHAAPFYRCAVLYVFGLIIGFISWVGWPEILRRSALALLIVTFIAHTLAIGTRVYISGYPPITNLYGTAVFIGWGCALLGIFLEFTHRIGTGNLLASIAGFLTLLIAHFLAGDGDTLQMMQAVLDTKFWLATHVIIINFGYSATFLAGGIAVAYLLKGTFTKGLDAQADKTLGRMMYGVLCFALLLSFLGTVLGGLWADDSWGRFWGWDPKENGALMIVLWNALILHARWGGVVRNRGIATLAVFGNIVTSWSWFGVNQLGVGLHSYGFTESVSFWLMAFAASQVAIMGLGLMPRRLWRSPEPTRAQRVRTARSPAEHEKLLDRERTEDA